MRILLLSESDVRRLLPMSECVSVMRSALRALAEGRALQPLRTIIRLPDQQSALASMPAYTGDGSMGVKVVTVFPGNHGTALESHQGLVLLLEAAHGSPVAVLDAVSITAIRTAAVSAIATDLLSRENSSELAILGAGVQARTHVEALLTVRPFRRIRIWSRTPAHADRFADWVRSMHQVQATVHASARDAVSDADVVCTVTSAREPVLEGAWLSSGAHINAVGTSSAAARELDSAAVAACRLFVDSRESALSESGEVVLAIAEGAIQADHIQGELGELLLGSVRGRTAPDEITLFKSLGLAVEDVAAADHVVQRARAQGIGSSFDLSGVTAH